MAESGLLTVQTSHGPVIGKPWESVLGDKIISFHRIPYIKPPIGALRFREPQPPEIWTTPIDGTSHSGSVPSYHEPNFDIKGDENAVHMNVYTKNVKPIKLLPVMVFIHGGAFIRGSSSPDFYSPDYLLQKEVVLFSFNYRLGALGFLSFNDPALGVPGNAGIKDQRMALEWIRKNAQVFGGDPTNITVFGESAGGASVHLHMLSEKSKGLFDRAIAMSGVALNSWAFAEPRDWGRRLATAVGWNGEGGEKGAFDVLCQADAFELVEKQSAIITVEEKKNLISMSFGPVIEPYVTEQCVVPVHPFEMMQNAWSNYIPLLIGATRDEGLIFKTKDFMAMIFKTMDQCAQYVPQALGLGADDERRERFGAMIRKFYYGDSEPNFENSDRFVKLFSDTHFTHDIHRVLISRARKSNLGKTYCYRFEVDSPRFNHFRVLFCGPEQRGASHADDLSYLFKNAFYEKSGGLKPDDMEFLAMQRMVGIWTSFAVDGNLNCDEINPVTWDAVTSDALPYKCLNISNTVSFIDHPETERMKFWDDRYRNVGCADRLFN